jgi:hypothetical protein
MTEKELNEARDKTLALIGRVVLDMKEKLDETREILRMVYKEEPEIYHSRYDDSDENKLYNVIADIENHYEELENENNERN